MCWRQRNASGSNSVRSSRNYTCNRSPCFEAGSIMAATTIIVIIILYMPRSAVAHYNS